MALLFLCFLFECGTVAKNRINQLYVLHVPFASGGSLTHGCALRIEGLSQLFLIDAFPKCAPVFCLSVMKKIFYPEILLIA